MSQAAHAYDYCFRRTPRDSAQMIRKHDSPGPDVVIGNLNGERLVFRRVSANGPEDWFGTEVEIQCDGWRGKFSASFMKGELSNLARDLRVLHEKLQGEATLRQMEGNLELSFVGDGKGHIEAKGIARNRTHTGTELSFRLELDQTFLPAIVKGLADIDP